MARRGGAPEPELARALALLETGLAGLGAGTDAGLAARLRGYLELLARWNRVYNLTAARDPVTVVRRHLLDSLAVLPWIGPGPLLDAGTGAGLPGLVLAAARPGLRCVLLDASAKRTRFCLQAAATLGLENVQVVHSRLEDFRPPAPPAEVISRATWDLAGLLRCAAPCLAPGGRLLAMKGRYPAAELEVLGPMRENVRVVALAVPGLGAERHLVIIPAGAAPAGRQCPAPRTRRRHRGT